MSSHAAFATRTNCIACGGERLASIWSGSVADEPVHRWLDAYHYNADLDSVLGGARFDRVQCAACTTTFHRYVLGPDEVGTLYSEWIDDRQVQAFESEWYQSHPGSRDAHVRTNDRILRGLRKLAGPNAHLLDFGCGAGAFVAAAAAVGFYATGVDFSTTRIMQSEVAGVRIVGSLDHLVPTYRADIVTMFEVLEHLIDPRSVLEQLAARMSDRGLLVVSVPDCTGIDVPNSFDEFMNVQMLEHVNHFTPATLDGLMARVGFDRVAEPWVWTGPKPFARRLLKGTPAIPRWYQKR